jgi:hypothetical protein
MVGLLGSGARAMWVTPPRDHATLAAVATDPSDVALRLAFVGHTTSLRVNDPCQAADQGASGRMPQVGPGVMITPTSHDQRPSIGGVRCGRNLVAVSDGAAR